MKRHVDQELKKIKEKLFKMGILVEQAIENATAALLERDNEKAKAVIKQDQDINIYEIEIDELGHEMIALFQPAAADLRFITMALKMTSCLERIGDQAVNIAEKALVINQEPAVKAYEDLPKLAKASRLAVRESMNAFMEQDQKKAKDILERDDEIDRLNDKIYDDVQKIMQANPKTVKIGVSLIMVAHNLERIGDLATNIAEDVIYLKQGKEVRHRVQMSGKTAKSS